jgi:glutamine amidotransferase-like uncharacterized protein
MREVTRAVRGGIFLRACAVDFYGREYVIVATPRTRAIDVYVALRLYYPATRSMQEEAGRY